MDFIEACRALNVGLMDVLLNTNTIKPVVVERTEDYVRLQESVQNLTEEVNVAKVVASAHNLDEYVSKFYTIDVKEDIQLWLDELLSIDSEVISYDVQGVL